MRNQKLPLKSAMSDSALSKPSKHFEHGLVWLRRDLRLSDNAALAQALASCKKISIAFVFDKDILDVLPKADRRVEFIWQSVSEINQTLQAYGSHLICTFESARTAIVRLSADLQCDAVFTNHDYEPQAVARDEHVFEVLKAHGRAFFTFKDQVVFEKSEVLTAMGKPFTVFTPYKNAWLKKHTATDTQERTCDLQAASKKGQLNANNNHPIPSLQAMGFETTNLTELGMIGGSAAGEALLNDFSTRMSRYEERSEERV